MLTRELTIGGQELAGTQVATGDAGPELTDDLLAQRFTGSGSEVEQNVDWSTVHMRHIR